MTTDERTTARSRYSKTQELFYDSIADDFLQRMDQFDLQTRIGWFDRALSAFPAQGAVVVDVGAGLGHFSEVAKRHGARPVPIDIAPRLISRLHGSLPSGIVASATSLPCKTGSVDVVVSSECIEHTPDPIEAVREMLRVLRPGGILFVTTPNLVWRWSITLAAQLGVRRFAGIENWLSRRTLRRTILENGGEILEASGLHILPFQLKLLLPLIRLMNQRGQCLKAMMINQCWIARKRGR